MSEFFPRFIDGYCKANRQKPRGISAKETVFNVHILPLLGAKRLDAITTEDIQTLKLRLANKAPKTVNNVLTALGACLKYAGPHDQGLRGQDGLGIIERVPRVRLLEISSKPPEWYELGEYERLVEGAEKTDPRVHLTVLLAGDAGLRRGEILALKWTDLDLKRGLITVERSIWSETTTKRHETSPKGGVPVTLNMTPRLTATLTKYRHLRGPRVLYADNGREPTNKTIRTWMQSARKRAGLKESGKIHMLRHTFCSNLAAEGAPEIAVMGLARHKNSSTTAKYMHVAPSTLENAIGLLDRAQKRVKEANVLGDILETATKS